MALLRGESGAVVILFTLILVAFLGMLALGVDVGHAYVVRSRLANVADAAALAGAQELPDDPEGALAVARDYALRNGIDPADLTLYIPEDRPNELHVSVRDVVVHSVARVLGFTSSEVVGRSVGASYPLAGVSGARPFGVEVQDFVLNEVYLLKLGPQSEGGPYRGNFHALSLGGTGASRYRDNILNGYDGQLQLGDEIPTEPGNMAGPTASAMKALLSQDPDSTYQNYSRNSPRLLLVPLVESFEASGKEAVSIIGFAMFFLEGWDDATSEIRGRFIRYVMDGEAAWGAAGTDFGLRTVKVIE